MGDYASTRWKRFLGRTESGLLMTILVLSALIAARSPVFLSGQNFANLFNQVAMTGVTAIGMTLLMIAGEVDLSVGSMQALIGVVTMAALNSTHSLWGGLVAGLGLSALIGLVNGLITIRLGITSLITTLAMLSIVRAAAYSFTTAAVQNEHNLAAFSVLGNGYLGFLPIPGVIMAAVAAICYVLLHRTTFGRYVHAVGGNKKAAVLSGIHVTRVKMATFVLTSVLAGLSAILLTSRMNSGQNNAGFGFELEVVAAVLLGGCSLSGGEGSIAGTLLAVLLLGLIGNGINLLDISSSWQVAITGFIILAAVFMDARRRQRQPH